MPDFSFDRIAIVKAIDDAKRASETRGFIQSIDLILSLRDLDVKSRESRINELIELPHLTSKQIRIGVFATGDLALRAKETGVVEVFGREDLDRFAGDKKEAKKVVRDIDYFLAEAPLMSHVARILGPIIGPRGKMPRPVPPTAPVDTLIESYQRMVRIRARSQLSVQCRVGTEDMPSEEIAENVQAVLARLERMLPKGLQNVRQANVKTTMGPLSKIELG